MLATVIGISGVILIILLAQYARMQIDVKRVQRARQHEAAIKEFEELFGFSPYKCEESERVQKTRRVLHRLAKEYLGASFAHDMRGAELARKKRLRAHELAAYFGINVRKWHHSLRAGGTVADHYREQEDRKICSV